MEENRAGMGGISGKPACRRTEKGSGDERVPGGFFICPGEACLHPGLCGLHTGIVPYGAPEGERGAEVGREDGCALKDGPGKWRLVKYGMKNRIPASGWPMVSCSYLSVPSVR